MQVAWSREAKTSSRGLGMTSSARSRWTLIGIFTVRCDVSANRTRYVHPSSNLDADACGDRTRPFQPPDSRRRRRRRRWARHREGRGAQPEQAEDQPEWEHRIGDRAAASGQIAGRQEHGRASGDRDNRTARADDGAIGAHHAIRGTAAGRAVPYTPSKPLRDHAVNPIRAVTAIRADHRPRRLAARAVCYPRAAR